MTNTLPAPCSRPGAAPQPGNGVLWPPAWPSARAWVLWVCGCCPTWGAPLPEREAVSPNPRPMLSFSPTPGRSSPSRWRRGAGNWKPGGALPTIFPPMRPDPNPTPPLTEPKKSTWSGATSFRSPMPTSSPTPPIRTRPSPSSTPLWPAISALPRPCRSCLRGAGP